MTPGGTSDRQRGGPPGPDTSRPPRDDEPAWLPALRPLGLAAVAAGVIAVLGVGAGLVLRGPGATGSAGTGERATPTPRIPVVSTDNDFDQRELRRLAVGVDTEFTLPPGLTSADASRLAERRTAQLSGREHAARVAAPASVRRCLRDLLTGVTEPLVPVYVEVARFDGTPAVVYVFGAEDPASGTYRRILVRAVSSANCRVLATASYDRTGRYDGRNASQAPRPAAT